MARILYVSQGYSTHDWRFLRGLAQTSHEVWFLPYAVDPTPLESRPVPQGIHRLPALTNSKGAGHPFSWGLTRFRRHVAKIQPDLIHAGPIQTGGFLAALTSRSPLLLMSWGSDVLVTAQKNPLLRWVTSFTLNRAHAVVGDCQAVKERILSLSSLPPQRVVVFPFGVELSKFSPGSSSLHLRQRLGWEKCRVVISTRSLEISHGTWVFLRAMETLLRRLSDSRVFMLGDGTLRPQVEEFLKSRDLESRFHLAGQVPHEQLADYFNEADLYISAVLCDGTSISLLEAMACGLSVVVPEAYGNREWVTPGVNGWLYPVGDSAALAKVTEEALEDAQCREQIGRENTALVRAKADWEKSFGDLVATYDLLLANGVKPHA